MYRGHCFFCCWANVFTYISIKGTVNICFHQHYPNGEAQTNTPTVKIYFCIRNTLHGVCVSVSVGVSMYKQYPHESQTVEQSSSRIVDEKSLSRCNAIRHNGGSDKLSDCRKGSGLATFLAQQIQQMHTWQTQRIHMYAHTSMYVCIDMHPHPCENTKGSFNGI